MKKISDYGIMPDTNELLTEKLQYAIDDCANSGKTLVFEKGIYKTGTLLLRNNSKITLEKDAVISGSENIDDYPDNDASFTASLCTRTNSTISRFDRISTLCTKNGSLPLKNFAA